MGFDSCGCELDDCEAPCSGAAGARWPGIAARRTLTRKRAPNKMPALAARWRNVLREDIRILLTSYYASRSRGVSPRAVWSASRTTGWKDRKEIKEVEEAKELRQIAHDLPQSETKIRHVLKSWREKRDHSTREAPHRRAGPARRDIHFPSLRDALGARRRRAGPAASFRARGRS